MKKVIFTNFGITLPMLAICLISYGQATSSGLRFSDNISSTETPGLNVSDNPLSRDNVNSKALKDFTRSYKNVSNEKWYNIHGGSVAMFSSDGIDCRVDYDDKGKWVRTIRTYDETRMQEDLRRIVKSNYYDYQINLVNEIIGSTGPATYMVQLVGKTKIINLRICDGEIEEWQKLNKSE